MKPESIKMYLKHVFGLLTLQTSTVLLSTLFINLAICILLVNILSLKTEAPTAWIVMFLFIFFTIVIWLMAFVGAYKESNVFLSVVVFSWTPYIVLWIALMVWSLMNTHNNTICIESRCPDVLWLLNSPWHTSPLKQMSLHIRKSIKPNNKSQPLYEKTLRPQNRINRFTKVKKQLFTTVTKSADDVTQNSTSENVKGNIEVFKSTVKINSKLSVTRLTRNNYGSKIISIITSLIYAIILLFSWMVVVSYKKEMQLQTLFTRSAV